MTNFIVISTLTILTLALSIPIGQYHQKSLEPCDTNLDNSPSPNLASIHQSYPGEDSAVQDSSQNSAQSNNDQAIQSHASIHPVDNSGDMNPSTSYSQPTSNSVIPQTQTQPTRNSVISGSYYQPTRSSVSTEETTISTVQNPPGPEIIHQINSTGIQSPYPAKQQQNHPINNSNYQNQGQNNHPINNSNYQNNGQSIHSYNTSKAQPFPETGYQQSSFHPINSSILSRSRFHQIDNSDDILIHPINNTDIYMINRSVILLQKSDPIPKDLITTGLDGAQFVSIGDCQILYPNSNCRHFKMDCSCSACYVDYAPSGDGHTCCECDSSCASCSYGCTDCLSCWDVKDPVEGKCEY